MPPVLGPVSPSPIRLWSWASGSATACLPSHSASSEHSGPLSRSSSTNGPSAAVARIAAIVSSSVSGTVTPLPAASPSSFTTTGLPNWRYQAMAASRVELLEALVGRTRHAERRRQVAAVPLRRLDPGLLRRRAEAGDLAEVALVGDAVHQRRLRARDHQVDVVAGDVAELCRQCHRVVVPLARPGDRVLAAAAPDHEHAHQASAPSNASLAWASWTAIG